MEELKGKILSAEVKAEPTYVVEGKPLYLASYEAVHKFKSVRRAQRRGHVTPWGTIAPKRPFNNRKRTDGRAEQLLKERIYGQVRTRFSA